METGTATAAFLALAAEFARAFERDKRDSGTEFNHLKNGSPQWMADVVREIHVEHGDRLPEDSLYQIIEECANHLSGVPEDTDIRDSIYELESDVAYGDLSAWFAAHTDNASYVDDYVDDYGWPKGGGVFAAIQGGQQRLKQSVAQQLANLLESRLDEQEVE